MSFYFLPLLSFYSIYILMICINNLSLYCKKRDKCVLYYCLYVKYVPEDHVFRRYENSFAPSSELRSIFPLPTELLSGQHRLMWNYFKNIFNKTCFFVANESQVIFLILFNSFFVINIFFLIGIYIKYFNYYFHI